MHAIRCKVAAGITRSSRLACLAWPFSACVRAGRARTWALRIGKGHVAQLHLALALQRRRALLAGRVDGGLAVDDGEDTLRGGLALGHVCAGRVCVGSSRGV